MHAAEPQPPGRIGINAGADDRVTARKIIGMDDRPVAGERPLSWSMACAASLPLLTPYAPPHANGTGTDICSMWCRRSYQHSGNHPEAHSSTAQSASFERTSDVGHNATTTKAMHLRIKLQNLWLIDITLCATKGSWSRMLLCRCNRLAI